MQVEDSCGGALSFNHPLGQSQHRPLTSALKSLFSTAIIRLLPTGSNSCAVSREEWELQTAHPWLRHPPSARPH
jgi:hypothetical protein